MVIPPGAAAQTLQILGQLSVRQIRRMQRGVRDAWRSFLSPEAAPRTLYALLREHVARAPSSRQPVAGRTPPI